MWSTPTGTAVSVPPIIDRRGRVVVVSSDGTIYRVTDGGTTGSAQALAARLSGAATGSPILLADDSLLVPAGPKLHRISDAGQPVWSAPRDLGATVTGVATVLPDASGVELYAVTAAGSLHALRADGSDAWSAQLSSAALAGPSFTVASGHDSLLFGGADGHVRAVQIDRGYTFAATPWPKPYGDDENRSQAVAPVN